MNNAVTYNIELINRVHLDKSYYYFDFKKPEGFHFIEGQYGLFGFVDKEIQGRRFRAFSIASTEDESIIRVGTRIGENPSDFKRLMLELSPGEFMTMNAPKGEFMYNHDYKAVFIAGGIGITPIRSMLLSQDCRSHEIDDELIYSELESNYPFKEEIEKLKGLSIYYAADIEPTQKLIREAVEKYHNTAFYYLSGSPGFVNGIEGLLVQLGVNKDQIRHDVFVGY